MKKGTMLWVGLVWVTALTLAAERGPWGINEVNLVLQDSTRGRKVEVLLLYPKGTEPLPWVAFSPGFLFTGSAYRSWGELLASHGMATALVSYAYSLFNPDHRVLVADLLFVLDTLPAEAQRYGVRLDPSRVALVGHSLGGKLSFLAAAERPVQAVVGLDPVDGGAPGVIDPVRFPSAVAAMGSVRAPVLLLGAEYGERVKFGTPCAPRMSISGNSSRHLLDRRWKWSNGALATWITSTTPIAAFCVASAGPAMTPQPREPRLKATFCSSSEGTFWERTKRGLNFAPFSSRMPKPVA